MDANRSGCRICVDHLAPAPRSHPTRRRLQEERRPLRRVPGPAYGAASTLTPRPSVAKPSRTNSASSCHGPDLSGGEAGPTLVGLEFLGNWTTLTLSDFYERVHATMPADAPGTMTPQQTADITAYVLKLNKFPAGTAELSTDLAELKKITIEGQRLAINEEHRRRQRRRSRVNRDQGMAGLSRLRAAGERPGAGRPVAAAGQPNMPAAGESGCHSARTRHTSIPSRSSRKCRFPAARKSSGASRASFGGTRSRWSCAPIALNRVSVGTSRHLPRPRRSTKWGSIISSGPAAKPAIATSSTTRAMRHRASIPVRFSKGA